MKDRGAVDFLASVMEKPVNESLRANGIYYASSHFSGAAVELLRTVLPYLRVKKRQAELVVEFWESLRGCRGKVPSDELVIGREIALAKIHQLNKRGVADREAAS